MKSKYFILICKMRSGMVGFLAIDFQVPLEPSRAVMVLALLKHGYSVLDVATDGPLVLFGYNTEEEAEAAFDDIVRRFSN